MTKQRKQNNAQFLREQLRAGREYVFLNELPNRSACSITRLINNGVALARRGSVLYLRTNITEFTA